MRPHAPSLQLARLIAAASDGLQLQWLCARADSPVAAPECVGGPLDMIQETRVLLDLIRSRWLIDDTSPADAPGEPRGGSLE